MLAAGRLLWLELRHNAMLWMLPVTVVLFWFTTYRKTMAMPPLWNLRAMSMQPSLLLDFAVPVVGAAAWMGSREGRRHTTDLVTTTARPPTVRLLTTWAATTCWALAGYLGCVAVLYGVTARHAAWGGPLWWPVAVVAAGVPALSALGFAAGTLWPTRFTAPAAAVASFFVLALSTQLIVGSQSFWQISPIVAGPWDFGSDAAVATFYPYLPDLPIAQVMFLAGLTVAVLAALALVAGPGGRMPRAAAASIAAAGLLAAGTAVALAGTGRLDAHGMIAIPALHDAASDRPLRFTPVCSHTAAIPVCLNPAYASYLPAVAAAVEPVLSELAGLPGVPARIVQSAPTFRQQAGNEVSIGMPGILVLPDLVPGQQGTTTAQFAAQVGWNAAPAIVASVVGGQRNPDAAQQAIATALLEVARVIPAQGQPAQNRGPGFGGPGGSGLGPLVPAPGSQALAAAGRFAALPATTRHAWLAAHLTALRAGHVTLAQLP